jgi:taurine dioxygenase
MTLRTERCTPAIGAEVLDPLQAQDLDDSAVIDAVYAALMEHHVLFFRNANFGPAELVTLGQALGSQPRPHHAYNTLPDHPDVVVLEFGGDKRTDSAEWHADMTYRVQPPFASILQAVVLPSVGGDTLWASMYSVLDSLPAGLRSELAELEAVHDLGAFRSSAYLESGQAGLEDAVVRAGMAVHPVVAKHPVTGRPYLNVSEAFTRFVIGISAPEGARLLTMLFDAINRPDHHVRLRWRPGTLALWDNRGTQHYACDDYLPNRRVMHRVAVATDLRTRASA